MTRARIIIAAVTAAIVVFLLLWGPAACQRMRSQGAQSKVDQAQSGAQRNSAADAISTQGQVNQNETVSRDLDRTNQEEIRNAEGASDPVRKPVADAGLHALCRREAYRDSERCRLLRAPAP